MIRKINIIIMLVCGLCLSGKAQLTGKGGAIYLAGGKVEGCLIKNNRSVIEGSGVYVESGNVTSSTIVNNNQIQNAANSKSLPAGMKLVFVPGGTGVMGSNASSEGGTAVNSAQKPQQTIQVGDFLMSETEVTVAQYCEFLNDAGIGADGRYTFSRGIDIVAADIPTDGRTATHEYINNQWKPIAGANNWPVSGISWYCMTAFCDFYGLRLPQEIEWEYAARGGSTTGIYSGTTGIDSTALASVAWFGSNSEKTLHNVKTKAPNAFGLYDMCGNVAEMCENYQTLGYDVKNLCNYGTTNTNSPRYQYHPIRGGGYASGRGVCTVSRRPYWYGNNSRFLIVSTTGYSYTDYPYSDLGFRVCL